MPRRSTPEPITEDTAVELCEEVKVLRQAVDELAERLSWFSNNLKDLIERKEK